MKLIVTGKQLDIPQTIRAAITKKIGKLDRLLNSNAVSAQCVVTGERQRFLCELTVHVRGDHVLHAVARHESIPAAVSAAVDRIGQQAHKVVDRWKDKRRTRRATAPEASTVTMAEPAGPRVIRLRRYPVKAMSVADATLVLEAGSDGFVVFRRADTEAVAVLYKRPDGHLGLIEPEI